MAETRCNFCGKLIEWATKHGGASIALERVRSFRVNAEGHATPAGEVLISHFTVCPKKKYRIDL
jgi:hypothetical protein